MRISWPVRVVVYLVVGIAAFCVLFPLLWMFFSALKSQADIIDPNAPIIPTHWEWSNISVAWNSAPFGQFYLNTAIFSFVTTAGQIATGMIAGYAFAMFDFPGRRVLFYGVLTGLMIPFTVVLVPVVQILATFGWVDTWHGPARPEYRLRPRVLPVPPVLPERPGRARRVGADRRGVGVADLLVASTVHSPNP